MATPELSKKRLALAIIDFLNTSLKDGTIPSEDAENIEIATNCIGDAFKVDSTDTSAVSDALGGKSLLDIYSVYEKLKGTKPAGSSSGSAAGSAAAGASGSTPRGSVPDAKTKEEAEKLKSQGNAAIAKKDYPTAIDFYTQALNLVPLNPIYLSNRAAAHSGAGNHEEAANDAEMAVAADPNFAKGWSRLGFAKYALGDAKGSMEAYKKGIDAEGSGGSDPMRKGYETAKRKVEEEGGDEDDDDIGGPDSGARGMGGPGGMPDLSALAGMFGGAGGAGGGGMPDFGAMMNNPMMRQMAQGLMSDPNALQNILQNPALRNMMGGAGRGGGEGAAPGAAPGAGGMPDIASLMQDPSIMEMARNMMGGMGGGPGIGGPGAGAGRGAGT